MRWRSVFSPVAAQPAPDACGARRLQCPAPAGQGGPQHPVPRGFVWRPPLLAPCGFIALGVSWVKSEMGPRTWGARTDRRAEPSTLVGGSFNKQGDLLTRLGLRGCKMSRSSHPPGRILSFYRGLHWVQPCLPDGTSSHVHPDGLNSTSLSRVCVPRQLLGQEGGRMRKCALKSRTGEAGRSLQLPWFSSRVRWRSYPLDDLLQCFTSCDWLL